MKTLPTKFSLNHGKTYLRLLSLSNWSVSSSQRSWRVPLFPFSVSTPFASKSRFSCASCNCCSLTFLTPCSVRVSARRAWISVSNDVSREAFCAMICSCCLRMLVALTRLFWFQAGRLRRGGGLVSSKSQVSKHDTIHAQRTDFPCPCVGAAAQQSDRASACCLRSDFCVNFGSQT